MLLGGLGWCVFGVCGVFVLWGVCGKCLIVVLAKLIFWLVTGGVGLFF